MLRGHFDAAFRTQCYQRFHLDTLTPDNTEPPPASDHGESDFSFQHCEAAANAPSRAGAKRHIGRSLPALGLIGQEAFGYELCGIFPVPRMAVKAEYEDDDIRTRRDVIAA